MHGNSHSGATHAGLGAAGAVLSRPRQTQWSGSESMNYCRQCHTYYMHGETCSCPSTAPAREGDPSSNGARGSTGAGEDAEGRRIPYPMGGNAVRTGLFD